MRNIFRYKKRLFMMIIGISGCTALLVTGFGLRDSIVHVADMQYDEIQIYDISVLFSKTIQDSVCGKMEEAADGNLREYFCVMENSVDVVADSGIKSATLVVAAPGDDISPFVRLCAMDGADCVFPGEGEAVMTHKMAEDLGVQEGDTVQIRNGDMETISVRISGISRNYINNYVYIGADTYVSQMKREPEYKTAYINVAEDVEVHFVSAALMGMEDVANVTVIQDDRGRITGMMQSMNLIVVLIIFCAGGLAFIVLYNLTNINITERIREIATIKVLGFYRNETASYVFRENILLTFMGAAVGVVMGYYLHLFVMSKIKVNMVAFDVNISFSGYLLSVILTLAFAWFVNLFMRIKLDKVSMTESLKSVD